MIHLLPGIYILLLTHQVVGIVSDFTENGKVLAKLCKHFSNERKTFPNFSRSRQKNEKSHIFQHPFGNLAHNRVKPAYDMNEIIFGYVIYVILTKFRINDNF